MTPHETGSTATPGTSRATAPPAGTFGPQGPTLGDLIDAYLQDYHVRQFRSQSTARGRTAHLTAFFGRAARAAALTTYRIRQYQLARRAAGAATGTINRPAVGFVNLPDADRVVGQDPNLGGCSRSTRHHVPFGERSGAERAVMSGS